MTNYRGIDYGLGKTNIDKSTGIRYGVMSQNSVLQAWADSSEPDYGQPMAACPECSTDNKAENWGDEITCACGHEYECELHDMAEPIGYTFEDKEYTLTSCLDSDIMVIKSPYFTYAQYCSPCVPGACNLESPLDVPHDEHDGNKCYCLGHDWFEEGKAPYTVYSVLDGSVILPE